LPAKTLGELIDDRAGTATGIGAGRPAEALLATILGHRTHRQYTEEPIAEELLDVLLACAQSAGSKSDLQATSIIRVRDPETRSAIAERIPSMPWIGRAPVFLVFCGDMRRLQRISEMRGHRFANNDLDTLVNITIDAALAMQTFTLAAEAAGLGCCAISAVRDQIAAITKLLEIPAGVYPIAGLCVGHPAREGWISMRLPRSAVVHEDRYDDSRLAEEVDAYDRRRDARFSIPAERQKYVDRYGRAEFYGWSEDVARQLSVPERAGFRAFLEAQGFELT
jgi:nitroreductase/FMN reductase [NAD(P)H]